MEAPPVTYSFYGRMEAGFDVYILRSRVPYEKIEAITKHYLRTWREVAIRQGLDWISKLTKQFYLKGNI